MTKELLAQQMNGREYGNEITDDEAAQAKASGLLVVFGYSDDNVELRGAVREEVPAWDGTEFDVPANGKIELDEDTRGDIAEKIAAGWTPPPGFRTACHIKAAWSPKEPRCSWLITTDVPHATFDIMEDGELFCRGVVIDFNAAKAAVA